MPLSSFIDLESPLVNGTEALLLFPSDRESLLEAYLSADFIHSKRRLGDNRKTHIEVQRL